MPRCTIIGVVTKHASHVNSACSKPSANFFRNKIFLIFIGRKNKTRDFFLVFASTLPYSHSFDRCKPSGELFFNDHSFTNVSDNNKSQKTHF